MPHDPGHELTPEQLELQQRARTFVEDRADSARARGRGTRRPAARGDGRTDQAGGDRRAAERRALRPRVRRPGLVDARVVPGQRAVRPGDERPALARAERLQRADSGHARAGRALRCPRPARRGRRRLRGHRGRGGLGSERDRLDRHPHRRRLADQRREVVRDLGRRRPRADRDGQRRSTGPSGCRRCSWSSPAPPGVEFVDNPRFTHNYPHGHPTIRFTDVEVGARRGDRRRGQRRRRSSAPGSPRSAWGSPPTGSARCGGCSTRPPNGR